MTAETQKLKAKLGLLNTGLTTLEDTLAPLLEQTLPETLVSLNSIEQAKLQTLLPYIINDLIFIYLKTNGIDPKTHPVLEELARVKRYFDKISSAENPETQKTGIDKAAATRFIKHAIAQNNFAQVGSSSTTVESQPSTFVPPRTTSKMVERTKYQEEMRAKGDESSSEDELEIVDGAEAPVTVSSKGKGKQKETEDSTSSTATKRKRHAMDPFAASGLDDGSKSEPISVQAADALESAKKMKGKKEKRKTKRSDSATTDAAHSNSESTKSAKKKKTKKAT
ncbi:unnamed protein product [Mycena citricolor]|uniref:Exosome complex protein n=1 Tax=Mycena citricolor TaxID=2018698 RepID=A0AAD2HS69_9AGAR|nr:unnamed protein product [Mycena citricolor]